MRSRTMGAVPVLAAVLCLTGCGSDPSAGSTQGDGSRTLTVLGAASLTGTFTTLAHEFEDRHPGVKVRLAFDSSATLAEQVNQGAPADVLATADEATMGTVVAENGVRGRPRDFASNHLQLVVPRENPAHVRTLQDLGRPGVDYVVCVDTAPCGKLAVTVLRQSGVKAKPASEEVDVKAVLSKVQLDEADAGLVYETDAVAGGGKVSAIDVPTSRGNVTTYPVAALRESHEPALAHEFLALVLSAEGRKVLADAGFGSP